MSLTFFSLASWTITASDPPNRSHPPQRPHHGTSPPRYHTPRFHLSNARSRRLARHEIHVLDQYHRRHQSSVHVGGWTMWCDIFGTIERRDSISIQQPTSSRNPPLHRYRSRYTRPSSPHVVFLHTYRYDWRFYGMVVWWTGDGGDGCE